MQMSEWSFMKLSEALDETGKQSIPWKEIKNASNAMMVPIPLRRGVQNACHTLQELVIL